MVHPACGSQCGTPCLVQRLEAQRSPAPLQPTGQALLWEVDYPGFPVCLMGNQAVCL